MQKGRGRGGDRTGSGGSAEKRIERRGGGLQTNCSVSVVMGNSSDGDSDRWPSDMRVNQTKKARSE